MWCKSTRASLLRRWLVNEFLLPGPFHRISLMGSSLRRGSGWREAQETLIVSPLSAEVKKAGERTGGLKFCFRSDPIPVGCNPPFWLCLTRTVQVRKAGVKFRTRNGRLRTNFQIPTLTHHHITTFFLSLPRMTLFPSYRPIAGIIAA